MTQACRNWSQTRFGLPEMPSPCRAWRCAIASRLSSGIASSNPSPMTCGAIRGDTMTARIHGTVGQRIETIDRLAQDEFRAIGESSGDRVVANFDASLGVHARHRRIVELAAMARLAHSTGPAAVPGTESRINSPTGASTFCAFSTLAVRHVHPGYGNSHMRGR